MFRGLAGVHEGKNGQPFAFITASSDLDTWSLTASPEAFEMLIDPQSNKMVPDGNRRRIPVAKDGLGLRSAGRAFTGK